MYPLNFQLNKIVFKGENQNEVIRDQHPYQPGQLIETEPRCVLKKNHTLFDITSLKEKYPDCVFKD